MLPHFLAHPVPFHTAFTAEPEMAVLYQERGTARNITSHGYLGSCSSTTIQCAVLQARNSIWDRILLELVERAEQCAGYICYFVRQYSRFYCEAFFLLRVI